MRTSSVADSHGIDQHDPVSRATTATAAACRFPCGPARTIRREHPAVRCALAVNVPSVDVAIAHQRAVVNRYGVEDTKVAANIRAMRMRVVSRCRILMSVDDVVDIIKVNLCVRVGHIRGVGGLAAMPQSSVRFITCTNPPHQNGDAFIASQGDAQFVIRSFRPQIERVCALPANFRGISRLPQNSNDLVSTGYGVNPHPVNSIVYARRRGEVGCHP